MKIRATEAVGASGRRLPHTGQLVRAGETVEVPDAIGASICTNPMFEIVEEKENKAPTPLIPKRPTPGKVSI